MTYTTEERGAHAVRHLFTFGRASQFWHLTDAPADVVIAETTYRAGSISRDGLRRSNEDAAGDLALTLALATPLAETLLTDGPGREPLGCVIRALHVASEGDVGASPASPASVFTGTVRGMRVDDAAGEVTLTIASFLSALDRPILTIITSPTCNNAIYDRRCGVNPADFATAGAVSALNGRVVTVTEAAALADGWFAAGMLRVGSGVLASRVFHIETHVGDALTLLEAPPAALDGADVTLYAGCDGTQATCLAKFNNLRHFLGFPRVPQENPFDDVRVGG